jgi:hypothetical protein
MESMRHRILRHRILRHRILRHRILRHCILRRGKTGRDTLRAAGGSCSAAPAARGR